jgi:hypothetical protein
MLRFVHFKTLTEVREMVEKWNYDYNFHRPHTALGNKTPNEMLVGAEDKNSNFEWSEK